MNNLPRVGGFITDVPSNLLRSAALTGSAAGLPFGTQPQKAAPLKTMPATDQVERRYGGSKAYGLEAPLPKQAKKPSEVGLDDKINNIYKAYASGKMDAEAAAEYERAIKNKSFPLPKGVTRLQPNATQNSNSQPLSAEEQKRNIFAAYKNGTMDVEARLELEQAVKNGTFTPPKGFQMGKSEEPSSILQSAKNLITGDDRKTAQAEALPDWAGMPELSDITSLAGWKTGLGTLLTTPEETVKVIKSNYPSVAVNQDEKGNYILTSSIDNKQYAIKPGFRVSDIPRAIGGIAATTPAGRATSIWGAGLAGAGTQAAIEASQAATGGEFNTSDVLVAGGLNAAVPAAGAILKGVKATPSAIKGLVRGQAPAAEKAVVSELSQQAKPIAAAVPKVQIPQAQIAKEVIRDAEKAGVRVLTSDVIPPKTFIGKTIQKAGESIPIAGTGGMRAAQQEQRIAAVKNVLADFGADDLAKSTENVTKDLLAKRSAELTKYATLKNEVIDRLDGAGVVPVNKTISVIDQEIAQIKSKRTSALNPVIQQLQDFKQAVQNQGLRNVEDLRKQLGENFKSPDLVSVKTVADKATNKIYGALREDMGDFIKATGERKDFTKWGVANARLKGMVEELDVNSFKSTLAKGEATPETINKMLFSKNDSDLKLLTKNLTPAGRANARAAILAKAADSSMVDAAAGVRVVNPDAFIRNVRKLDPSLKQLFSADDYKRIEGLARVITATKRAGEAAAYPTTGAQAVPFVAGSFLTDVLGGAGAATATAIGVGTLARAFESKPIRNLLLLLSKTKRGGAGEKTLMKKLAVKVRELPKEQRQAFAALFQASSKAAYQKNQETKKKNKNQQSKKED